MSNQIFLVDDSGRWQKDADPLTSNRVESWRFDLLDLNDSVVDSLDGVSGGGLRFDVNATIRGGGNLEYQGETINWLKHRVQPFYKIEAAGKVVEWPLGVFVPTTPGTTYGDGGKSVSVQLYDKTHLLDSDMIETSYSATKGSNVTDRVRTLIRSVGETKIAITDSEAVLSTGIVWESGTSKLEIINKLLHSINHFPIWVDGYGVFRSDPYLYPYERSIAFGFVDDETGIYSPEFVNEKDSFSIPNKVICIGQSDGASPAKTGVATNEDPKSDYSYQNRGGWFARTEQGVDASSQSVLNALAKRYLLEWSTAASTFDINHAPIPLDLNDAVGFRRDAEGIEIRGTVESMTYSVDVGALCQTKLQEA